MLRNNTVKTFFFLSIFLALVNLSYAQNTISGTVRYSDDNSLVTTGSVNAYDLSGRLIAVTGINPDGTYNITGLGGTQYDIIGFPNIEPEMEDFVPTGYPNAIAPQDMLAVLGAGTIINIDIYVVRVSQLGQNRIAASINGVVNQNNQPVKDAVVYATSGKLVYGFGITDKDGSYKINNLPLGDYIIVVHRIGELSSSKNITLTNLGIENLDFTVQPVKNTNNIVTTEPVEFKLSQNYPNPFNPSTVINYVIPKDGNVSLKVYNSLGELVTSLINTDQKAGAYSVKFDGANLSSGIYFYTLKTGSYSGTKRMVLIK